MPEEMPISGLITDFATRVKDIEERFRLLKERILLLNKTFLKEGERLNKEVILVKGEVRQIKDGQDRLKEGLERMMRDSAEFARRDELLTLQRFVKLWEPLRFVTEEQVSRMIEESLKKRGKK